jgi:hypothetical protein
MFDDWVEVKPDWVEVETLYLAKRRRQRKVTLTRALKEARKAGIPVASATITTEGISLTFGQEPTEAANPWLADLERTQRDLVNLALARARVRGTPGRISFTPDPEGGVIMWIDEEMLARGLDPDEIEQASSGRPLN